MTMMQACQCCCGCSNTDVAILVDTTGSMDSLLGIIKSIFSAAISSDYRSDTCQWLVADYKDNFDVILDPLYGVATQGIIVKSKFDSDFSKASAAISALSAGGGGDTPEENLQALKWLAENWTSQNGRSTEKCTRVILWFGDAPGWNAGYNGIPYPTIAATIDALKAAKIKVYGVNQSGPGSGIDAAALNESSVVQGSAICNATDGKMLYDINTPSKLEDALCSILSN